MGRLIVLLLFFIATASAALEHEHTDFSRAVWEPISEGDGIQVFRWSPPESKLFAFRAEATVDGPLAKVASVLIDSSRRHEWVPNLIECRILREISPNERIEYTAIRTPPFTKDRDFVFHGRAEWLADKKELILHFSSVEDPEAPPTGRIRGRVLDSTYRLKSIDKDKTWIEYRVHIDPAGSVAKWIVNLVQKNIPRHTLEAIRRQAAKPDVLEHPRVAELLKPVAPR